LVPYIIISNIFNISGSGGNGSDGGIVVGNTAQDIHMAYNDQDNHNANVALESHGALDADDLAVEFPVVQFVEEIVGSCESPFL
jgi:hypothetical protein